MDIDLDNLPNLDLDDIDPDTIGYESVDANEPTDDKQPRDTPKGLFLPDDVLVRLDMNLPKEATIDRTSPDGSLYRSIPAIVIKYFAATTFRDRLNSETLSMTVDSVEDGTLQNERGKFQTRQEVVTVHIKLTVKGENGHSQVHTAHGVGFGEATSELGPRYKAIAHKIAVKSAETDAFCAALERFGSVFVKAKDARAIISHIKNAQRKRHEEREKKARIVPGTAAFKGRPVLDTKSTAAAPVKAQSAPLSHVGHAIQDDDVPPFDIPETDVGRAVEAYGMSADIVHNDVDPNGLEVDDIPIIDTPTAPATVSSEQNEPKDERVTRRASPLEAAEQERALNTLPEPDLPVFNYEKFLEDVARLDDIEKIVAMRELYESDIAELDKKQKARIDKAIRMKMQALLSSPKN